MKNLRNTEIIRTDGWNEILDKNDNFVLACGNSIVEDAIKVIDEVSPQNAPHKLKSNSVPPHYKIKE